jgi:hypothetical protein
VHSILSNPATMTDFTTNLDAEKNAGEYSQLINTSVQSFSWKDVTVTVKERNTKQPKDILHGINGFVKAGEQSFVSFRRT